jgi:hemerythrin superfamily protein
VPKKSSGADVVDFLEEQHKAIEQLFTETLDAPDADSQRKSFDRLRVMLAVHEAAEEMFVHPRTRRKLANGAEIAEARLAEEHDAKVALQELEKIPHNTAEFSKALIHLKEAVLKHAEAEEQGEFRSLREELDADELHKMKTAVELAERIAPTHPHPGTESALANFAAGPFASLLDRSRDALRAALN